MFSFPAAVQRSVSGRHCTEHDLASVAGKWLTGARNRGGTGKWPKTASGNAEERN